LARAGIGHTHQIERPLQPAAFAGRPMAAGHDRPERHRDGPAQSAAAVKPTLCPHAREKRLGIDRGTVPEARGLAARADVVEIPGLAPVDTGGLGPVVIEAPLRLKAGQHRYVVLGSRAAEEDSNIGLSFHRNSLLFFLRKIATIPSS